MTIRKFRDSDSKELAILHRATIRNVNSQNYSKKQIDLWSGMVSAERFRKSGEKNIRFIAINNGKIIGFADYRKEDLQGLYIHKDYIGKGVGTKLLKRLEKDAYKNGVRTMYCISTITAQNFYEKNGYETLKKTRYRIKKQRLIVYKMRKTLKERQ